MSYVIFGTYNVGTGFTDGGTDPSGLEAWITTVTSIGPSDINVTTTYVDQDGNLAETTTTVTIIPANSQSGAWIKLILNADPNDTKIRDVTSITITGGTNGDRFQIVGLIPGRTFSYIRKVWDSFSIESLSGNNYNKPAMFSLAKLTPYFYPAPNPQMRPFISFIRKIWDSWSPEILTGNIVTGKIHNLMYSPWSVWIGEPLSGSTINSRTFLLQHGMYGNILSGYVRLPGGLLITSGFRVIFYSSSGFAVWGKCYPNGVYNVVLDLQRYDHTLLLVGSVAIDLYDQYGSFYADGYVNQNTSKDLYFIPHSNDPHTLGFMKRLRA